MSKARQRRAIPAAPPPPIDAPGLIERHERIFFLVFSLLLLIPCWWQARIEAGDLSSHIYNAWLAQWTEMNHPAGLTVVRLSTNVLFDLMLSGFYRILGAGLAQRLAVSLVVLVFAWGAFFYAAVVSGRKPWRLLPILAILAYGWVFRMGFFNFLLSLGLSLAGLALVWNPKPRRWIASIPLLAVAYVAHAFPPAWASGLLIYRWLSGRMEGRGPVKLMSAMVGLMLVVNILLVSTMQGHWDTAQVTNVTGADQAWIFDDKYWAVGIALLVVWGTGLAEVLRREGVRKSLASIPFHWWMLSAAAVVLIPSRFQPPRYAHALTFIPERLSLMSGVCLCAIVARARPRAFERYGAVVAMTAFFALSFRDERALNELEDGFHAAVAQLPSGARVVSAITDPTLHLDPVLHMIDRACLDRCFSYANYEPSTAAFRVRASAENPYVAYPYETSWRLQYGLYTAKAGDLPIYRIYLDRGGRFATDILQPNSVLELTPVRAL